MKCPLCKIDNLDDSSFCRRCGENLKKSRDIGSSITRTLRKAATGVDKESFFAGRYHIEEKLGEGGMGVVYKAKDIRLKRAVALKFLPLELTKEPESNERFVREAQAAAALSHSNICTIYETDEEEGITFITMEYIEGQTLREEIAKGPLEIDEALSIVIQIGEGLDEAHKKGVIHRDIKSSNIMVTEKGQAKIMDFGLAKVKGAALITKETTTIGTVAYMSPEQARGEEVDQRTDIWSLGIVLYEMITGQLPFKGEYEHSVVYSILNEAPVFPKEIWADIPRELQQIILKSLEKDREKRFQTVDESLHYLKKLRDESKISEVKALDLRTALHLLKKPRFAIAALAIFILIAAALFFPYRHMIKTQQAREQLPKIEELAQAGKYFEAYELATQAEKHFKNDSILAHLMPIISDNLTIITQPEGARVHMKRLATDEQGRFPKSESVGVTPITDLRIARSDYYIYLEKEGYVPAERIASSTLNRDVPFLHQDVKIEVKLFKAEKIHKDMVFVPGEKYGLVGWGLPTTAKVELDDYFMDKYEVRNQQFKAFIEAGGYLKKQYWKYSFIKDSRKLSWKEAMQQFVDRTGLPGPRSWTNQKFPEGKESHPVTDITWFEAAAYAQFAGKSLPTVFQWEKAARGGAFTAHENVVMPWGLQNPHKPSKHRANFEGQGPAVVDSFEFGISPYGCYNMAGNVKEWCLNEVSGGYVTTGGSWEDPQYMFAYYGAYSGLYSASPLGFRCARISAGARADQGAMKLNLEERIPSFSPVDEATFRSFLPYYKYDKRSLNAHVTETKETPDWTRQKITFTGVNDDRIIAYLFLPKRAAKPYQCLNFIPHSGVFYGVNTAEAAEHILAPHMKSGRAVLAVVPKGATEREWSSNYVSPEINTVRYREQIVYHSTEFSLGLDYLAARDDIDMKKLAYIGVSWGAHTAVILAAVEDRYRSVILIGGGLEREDQKKLPEANPINFVPYIKPPKLLMNGRYDEIFPVETHARPLYDLLSEPKKLVLSDAGHTPPLVERVPAINKWLDETLGPVKFE